MREPGHAAPHFIAQIIEIIAIEIAEVIHLQRIAQMQEVQALPPARAELVVDANLRPGIALGGALTL